MRFERRALLPVWHESASALSKRHFKPKRMSSRATSPKFRARYILIPSVASLGLAGYLLSHPPSPNTKLALSYPEDPLSLLDPDVLSDTPLHLQRASATALLQSYIVYLTSSFPALVDVAPSLFHHIESVRDNVPLLGRGFWYIALGSMRHTFFAKVQIVSLCF